MTDTNQEKEDEVLRRMLATKPTPHKTKEVENKSGKRLAKSKAPR